MRGEENTTAMDVGMTMDLQSNCNVTTMLSQITREDNHQGDLTNSTLEIENTSFYEDPFKIL